MPGRPTPSASNPFLADEAARVRALRRVVSRGDMVRLLRWYVPEGDHLYSDSAEAQTPPGSLGVVSFIDDSGTIHCVWESGFSLGLITERGVEDVWQLVR